MIHLITPIFSGTLCRFPDLFSAIEIDIESRSLGISSYGLSMTTLEEVFLQLGEEEEAKEMEKETEREGKRASLVRVKAEMFLCSRMLHLMCI